MWQEFKPALKFVIVFVGLYLAGNVAYGLFVASWHQDPDPVTRAVAFQTAAALRLTGDEVRAVINTQGPTVFLRNEVKSVINIYEGCNGINVMIVFLAFLLAFGGVWKKMLWFVPAGLIVIHLMNIVRLVLLYWFAVGYPHYFYYFHKYIFTAVLYLIIILLWYVWVARINGKQKAAASSEGSVGCGEHFISGAGVCFPADRLPEPFSSLHRL